jgi:antitoxin ParD1/3/4
MSITLPAEMVRIIRAEVEAGGYASNSEVIREAMRNWMDHKRRLATFEAAIDRGVADAEAGRVRDSEQLRHSLLQRLGAGEDTPDR